jgi:hypothetical protein
MAGTSPAMTTHCWRSRGEKNTPPRLAYIAMELAAFPAVSVRQTHRKSPMHIALGAHLAPIVSLIAGILILVMPRLLNYIVAVYLIVIGLIGLNIFH